MREEGWKHLKQFYRESFGISEDVVDLLACNDVLLLCASGSSTDSISKALDIDLSDIKDILLTVFDFQGWKIDLDFNPYSVFCYLHNMDRYSYKDFSNEVTPISSLKDENSIATMFRICVVYEGISLKLDKEWI